jgi:hypothetical protein
VLVREPEQESLWVVVARDRRYEVDGRDRVVAGVVVREVRIPAGSWLFVLAGGMAFLSRAVVDVSNPEVIQSFQRHLSGFSGLVVVLELFTACKNVVRSSGSLGWSLDMIVSVQRLVSPEPLPHPAKASRSKTIDTDLKRPARPVDVHRARRVTFANAGPGGAGRGRSRRFDLEQIARTD